MIPNVTNAFIKFNPSSGIWNRRTDKEEIKNGIRRVYFAKKNKLLVDKLSSLNTGKAIALAIFETIRF